jgi:tetratricopeptide (TPR) repeat protein/tRNA A-37 threonylcarbamoyl transferase component Bud32
MAADSDGNLLLGILALQNGLIDRDQLVAAFEAWTRDTDRSLADHLVARGDLDAEKSAKLQAMVAERPSRLSGQDAEATRTHAGSGDATGAFAVGTTSAGGRRFRVLRPHARGGLGAVFVALDEELHREVALKQILESHADNPISRQRFVLEAEITGGLEHPGIVPVYGLGTYEDGRPYYAMRFIEGDSLREAIARFHADAALAHDPGRRSLELHKLLRRFLDVCNAIAYAHARGVLHRDIKPGNVIVGRHGETLVVDWGLAKARGRNDVEPSDERPIVTSSASGSIETQDGSTLGTPAYMSPEQARGDLERLGPQSDVYSLGATLYCLLTGRPPVEGGDVVGLLRSVQEGEFPPPRRLDPSIDPPLEAVCLKAMALSPEARYATPRALADDVERWMADEPVTAWREPVSRRARRWARRNRTKVAAASVALAAVLVGLAAVASVQTRANKQLRLANDATKRALAESEESRNQAEATSAFLVQAFRSPDPSQDGRQVKVVEVLDKASERLDKEFTGSPATRGTLLDALGRTYQGLGMADRAIDLLAKARTVLESALGAEHPLTLQSRGHLANAYSSAGRTQEATALNESTLKLLESKLGPDHPDTLQCRNDLGADYWWTGQFDKAIAMHQKTLELREAKLGPDHRDTLQSRQNLAISLYSAGRLAEATPMFESVLPLEEKVLGPNHPFTLETRNDLATAYRVAGRLAEATKLDEELVKLREAKLGPDHPDTITSRGNLALDYSGSGRLAQAIATSEEVLRLRTAKQGIDHPDTLIAGLNLADFYREAGRTREAIALDDATLRRMKVKLGPDHAYTLICAGNLATAYLEAGRPSEAISLFRQTLETGESKLGPDSFATLSYRGSLATAYESLDRWTEAQGLRRESLARRRGTEKPAGPLVAGDLAGLGRNLLAQARSADSERSLRESVAIFEKALPDDWKRYDAMSLLGGAVAGQGRYAEAEPLVVSGYEGMKERASRINGLDRVRLHEAAVRVVRLYEAWGKPEKAAEWRSRDRQRSPRRSRRRGFRTGRASPRRRCRRRRTR